MILPCLQLRLLDLQSSHKAARSSKPASPSDGIAPRRSKRSEEASKPRAAAVVTPKTLGTALRPPFSSARHDSWRQSLYPSRLLRTNHPRAPARYEHCRPLPARRSTTGDPFQAGSWGELRPPSPFTRASLSEPCTLRSQEYFLQRRRCYVYQVRKRTHHTFGLVGSGVQVRRLHALTILRRSCCFSKLQLSLARCQLKKMEMKKL